MASNVLLLLLAATSSPAWAYYYYYGGTLTVSLKGSLSNSSYEVELRNKQARRYCYINPYTCLRGNCGSQIQSSARKIAWESYGLNWCQKEMTTRVQLPSNLPFQIRYPTNTHHYYSTWISNIRGYKVPYRMMAHVDLGTRSDTRRANRLPVSTMLPIVRVTRNCPRTFNLNVVDPDGDRVRCRVPTNSETYECNPCGLSQDFSMDEGSCTLTYGGNGQYGYHPIELMVEDFPHREIKLFYTNGFHTVKEPLAGARHKRQASIISTPTPENTNTTPEPTTSITTTTTSTTQRVPVGTEGLATRQRPTMTTTGQTSQIATVSAFRHSIPPLSKLPLQFSVLVDWHSAPSCSEGDYFPVFLTPTPASGAHIPAFVDHMLEITVRSSAQYSSIYRLLLTGPSGIYNQRVSTGTYVIKWTPTAAELDDSFPICFLSEGLYHYRVYHSELRCVTVNVVHHEAVVTCNETAMKVEVEKDNLIRRHENKLHLKSYSPTCNLKTLSNKTHLVAIMPLNSCGTYVEEDDDNIIFRNEITSADSNEIISRHNDVDIAIACAYPKRTNLTVGFRHKNPYAFKEKGFGSFTFQFEFFNSQRFRQQVDGSTYPVEVYLKQMIYMQIEATSSIPDTELFVESCRATPYDNPNSRISYSIIENGCVKDRTVQVYNGSRSRFRFGMEAFEFIGAHDEVYITCSVLLCEYGVPNTRCSQGCIPVGSHRRKREVAVQSSSHFISQGPLRLATSSDSPVSYPGLNLGLNVVFIVGCLLACGVVVYRSRRPRAKYQLLPNKETD